MRNIYIDRLRGLAILIVVLSHSSGYLPWYFPPIPIDFFLAWLPNGYYGVSIFFVISGFLITSSVLNRMEKTGSFGIIDFYARRIARIMPCLILMVALALALTWARIPPFSGDFRNLSLYRLLGSVFSFQFNKYLDYYAAPPSRVWDPLWSLSIEEMFYLTFPILFIFIRHKRAIFIFLIILVFLGPIMRYTNGRSGIYDYLATFDQIAMGCIVAFIKSKKRKSLSADFAHDLRWIGLIIIFSVLLLSKIETFFIAAPTIIGIGSALYLFGSTQDVARGRILLRPIEIAGIFSYETYLFHMFILIALTGPATLYLHRTLTIDAWCAYISMSVFLVSLIGSAFLISKYFSTPANIFLMHLIRVVRSRSIFGQADS